MVCIKLNTLLAACPSGRFGLKCINRCDTYYSGNESCDPVIGICTKGCKQEYKGLLCGLGNVTNHKPLITGQNSVRYHSMSYWISKVNNKMM